MMTSKQKRLTTIICLLLTLLFNIVVAPMANAYNIGTNVLYERSLSWGNSTYPPTYQFKTPNGNVDKTGMAVYAPLNGTGQYSLYYIKSGYRTNITKGKIYSVNISFDFSIARSAQVSSVDYSMYSGNSYFRLLGINKVAGREFCSQWQENTNQSTPPSGSLPTIIYQYKGTGTCTQSSDTYEIILQAISDGENIQVQIGNYNGDAVFTWTLSEYPFISLEPEYGTISVSPMNEWTEDSAKAVNEQQQQAGEQAQSDGQTAGNQAQTDIDGQTTNLFGIAGTVLGALKDTPASDCSITGNMGNVDMGNLNLCQGEIGPLRTIIQVILYLVMALATWKMVIWVIGTMAGLINWVQTGRQE